MKNRRDRLRVAQGEPPEATRGSILRSQDAHIPPLRIAGDAAGAVEPARTAELVARRFAGLTGCAAAVYLCRPDGMLALESAAAPGPVPGLNSPPLVAARALAAGRVVTASAV